MIIYKITNLINGKIYVGKQLRENNLYFGSGKLILKAIKKYGIENFKKEILEKCKTSRKLCNAEKFWIKKLNSQNKEIGYNITSGGEGFESNHKQSSKEKIRKWFKNKKYETLYGDNAEIEKKKRSIGVKKSWTILTKLEKQKRCKNISDNTKKAMKKIVFDYKILICPFCNKKGKSNAMYRWHFQKCKLKIDS